MWKGSMELGILDVAVEGNKFASAARDVESIGRYKASRFRRPGLGGFTNKNSCTYLVVFGR